MIAGGHHVNWLPLGLVLLLATLGFWLNNVAGRIEAVDNAGFTHDPDYIVENFDALAFDIGGRPQHRLTAERMVHYMDDDTTVLDNPRFHSLDPASPVKVEAKRALISTDGKRVFFLNRVQVTRASSGGQAPITLDTEYLQVNPEERIMLTDRSVTLRQGRSNITANGLIFDESSRRFSLEGRVRGTYEAR
jgi:lipopolysaccharide export system protein LptC